MKNATKKEYIRDEVLRILDINYLSPHASPPGTEWKDPLCGDCFCADQSRHTHATTSYLTKAEGIISFIERELDL